MLQLMEEPIESPLFQAVMEGNLGGLLLVTPERKVIQSNSEAESLCHLLRPSQQVICSFPSVEIPDEIWQLCMRLINARQTLVEELNLLEEQVVGQTGTAIRVRVQWICSGPQGQPCMLVLLENHSAVLHSRAIADGCRYGLTPRETEIWEQALHGLSYEAIAAQCYVSLNTVKKHMKNIYSKQRCFSMEMVDE